MALDKITENEKIEATTTAKYADFDSGVRKVNIVSDADCFVSFDENVATTSSFLMKANTPHEFQFDGGGPRRVWAITASSTANVYLLVIR